MPIYEYRCRACGQTTERLRAMDDADAPLDCACAAPDVVRLPSVIARPTPGSDLPQFSGSSGCCGGGCGCASG